ncbi:MAG: hypothetical protein ACXVDZ_12200 [Bacteroidia bacterium]
MINERVKYTANTGMGLISAANTNLDGSGTVVTILTAASNGTLIETVTVKATQTTTRGMVRLFVYDGTNSKTLIHEVQVPPTTASALDHSFVARVPLNLNLKSGYSLLASTQNAETFQVIAEGLDWTY